MNSISPAQLDGNIRKTAALAISEKPLPVKNSTGTAIVAELIAERRIPELFGLLGLVSDQATQEKLLAKLPLLPWYPPDPSEGSIWREE